MRVIVTAMGSVEDLPPFIALSSGLRDRGIDCHLALPSNLLRHAKSHGFPVTQLGPDELGQLYEEAEPALQEGRESEAIERYGKALQAAGLEAFQTLAGLCEQAACLIGSITMPLGRMVQELTGTRYLAVQTHNPSERIATPEELVTFRTQLGLPPANEPGPSGISPTYGFSSTLILVGTSRSVLRVMVGGELGWPPHCYAPGFFYLPEIADYQPGTLLGAFVETRPVVFALGTRRRAERDRILALYDEAARIAGRQAVCRDAWSAGEAKRLSDNMIWVGDDVPESWLFGRAACVVHDADGGVTASAFRAGVPTVPIPSDPSLMGWARAGEALGCSPAVVPYQELSADRLGREIGAAARDATYLEHARAVRAQVVADSGVTAACERINAVIGA